MRRVGARRGFGVLLARRDVLDVGNVTDRDLRLVGVAIDVRRAVADYLLEPGGFGASGVELLLGVGDHGRELGEVLRGGVELGAQLREHRVVAAHLYGERAIRLSGGVRGRRRRCRRRCRRGRRVGSPGRALRQEECDRHRHGNGEQEGGDGERQSRVGAHGGTSAGSAKLLSTSRGDAA